MPAEARWQQTIDQQFPLSIYLNTQNGWELVEHLPTVGPLAPRDFAIPIELSKVNGEQVELRLHNGSLMVIKNNFIRLNKGVKLFFKDYLVA